MTVVTGKGLRRRIAWLLAIAGPLVLFAAAALLFSLPWLTGSTPVARGLDRYFPMHDGASFLMERYDPAGQRVSVESQNLSIVPPLRAFTGLRKGWQGELQKVYGSPGRMKDAQVAEVSRRTMSTSGEVTETRDLLIREQRGLFLLGSYDTVRNVETVFDAPVLLLPSDVGENSRWQSEGKAGTVNYKVSGSVLEISPFKSGSKGFDDCLKVETRMAYAPAGQQQKETVLIDRYCAGVGLVESLELDTAGRIAQRAVLVSSSYAAAVDQAKLPEGMTVREKEISGGLGDWRLTYFGSLRNTGDTAPGTIPPLWVPTDPPVVLAAGYGGDLLAFDTEGSPGAVRWRFHTGGTIYGPPAFDGKTGRIYFGSTDKRLYALDARGLFLWSFKTGDNVASRPAIAGDTVIFGSEDRKVYALDAGTGRLRWERGTGGPVVSSAAVIGDVAVIGSDDGGVYGLDVATGQRRWLHVTGGPVEAPVVADKGVAYVASRSGEVTALDAGTGEEAWVSASHGVLRTAPVLAEAVVFVVNGNGSLIALDRRTGRELWKTPEAAYAGPPLLTGGELLVASTDGNVHRFGLDGKKIGQWEGKAAANPLSGAPGFSIGPVAGGGAVWLGSENASVSRIGPPAGPASIQPLWGVGFSNPPFRGESLSYVTKYREEALLVGGSNNIYLIDINNGKARKTGRLEADAGGPVSSPVAEGDTLLAASGDTLYATDISKGRALWKFKAGSGFRPPMVAGNKVLWVSTREGGKESTLHALDIGTGAAQWEAPIKGAGGVVVKGDAVYSNPAAAFDIRTGDMLWRTDPYGIAAGGPVLNESGDTLFTGAMGEDGQGGSVTAVNTRDGAERWRIELSGESINFSDRLWLNGSTLVVPVLSGSVIGLDATTGKELWRYKPPTPRMGNVTVEGGRVWMALQDGELLALDASSGRLAARSNDYSMNLDSFSLNQQPLVIGDKVVFGAGAYLLGFQMGAGRP